MARSARRYDIYLPLIHNDGRSVPREHFESVEHKLLTQFGGVTSQKREFPLRGIWQGESRLYLDEVIVMTALDFRASGSARFIASLKRELLQTFDQLEILLTETKLHVH